MNGLTELMIKIILIVLTEGTKLDAESLQFNSTKDSVLFAFSNEMYKYFIVFGIGLTIIYFIAELNQKLALEGRDLNLKTTFAPFLKLVAAIIILSKGGSIIGWIIELSNSIIQYFAITPLKLDGATGVVKTIADLKDELVEGMEKVFGNSGWIVAALMCIPCLLLWIISLVLNLVWEFKIITYKIEFFFRLALTPVALADIYSGQNANAVRWVKGMLGFGLYGAGIIFVSRMVGVININTLQDFATKLNSTAGFGEGMEAMLSLLKFVVGCLVVPFAGLGSMSMIRSVAKEAMG